MLHVSSVQSFRVTGSLTVSPFDKWEAVMSVERRERRGGGDEHGRDVRVI